MIDHVRNLMNSSPRISLEAPDTILSLINGHPWVKARVYHRAQQLTTSEDYYRTAIEESPKNPVVRHQYGTVLYSTDLESLALEQWRVAKSESYWLNLAKEQMTSGHSDLAKNSIHIAYQLAPMNPMVQFTLAEYLFSQEAWMESMDAYTDAIEYSEDDDSWLFTAYLNRGQARMNFGSSMSIIENDFFTAMEIRADDPWSYLRLCELYRLNDQLDVANEFCLIGVELSPKSPFTHYYLGRVYFEQSNIREAIHSFEEALELDPDLDAAVDWLDRSKQQSGIEG